MRLLHNIAIIDLFCLVTLFPSTSALADEFSVTLDQNSSYSRIDFDEAYQTVWSGDVIFDGVVVGDFTASLLKTILTGLSGAVMQYDIVLPSSGLVGDFISIRVITSLEEAGSDQGVIFAASPALKFLIGANAFIHGGELTIAF